MKAKLTRRWRSRRMLCTLITPPPPFPCSWHENTKKNSDEANEKKCVSANRPLCFSHLHSLHTMAVKSWPISSGDFWLIFSFFVCANLPSFSFEFSFWVPLFSRCARLNYDLIQNTYGAVVMWWVPIILSFPERKVGGGRAFFSLCQVLCRMVALEAMKMSFELWFEYWTGKGN
jgi:hypothetical protein